MSRDEMVREIERLYGLQLELERMRSLIKLVDDECLVQCICDCGPPCPACRVLDVLRYAR